MDLDGSVRSLIEVISGHLPVETEENHEALSQYSRCHHQYCSENYGYNFVVFLIFALCD
jgi:hypothetical protein